MMELEEKAGISPAAATAASDQYRLRAQTAMESQKASAFDGSVEFCLIKDQHLMMVMKNCQEN